jgi:hypothetical protein
MVKLRQLFSRMGFGVALLMLGCSQPTLGKWEGPGEAAQTKVTQWTFGEVKAKLLESKHYHVYTTIKEDEVLDLLPQVIARLCMRKSAPGVQLSDHLTVLFSLPEWDEYTKICRHRRQGLPPDSQRGYTIYDATSPTTSVAKELLLQLPTKAGTSSPAAFQS